VTKLKALEGKYRIAAAEAEQNNRLKDEFLATLSHELRTPLNAILGWLRMLRSGVLRGERREYALEVLERNAHAQEQLVADLLDVSRITGGRLRLDVRRTSLGGIVAVAVDTVRPAAVSKQITLDLSLDPCAEDVLGDADRLRQVAWNLLTNAVKFTPAGGRVQVTLAQEPACVVLTVRDSGQGIDPEFLPYVFDRFRQANSGLARAHGGLGLGLAITRNIVEMHGGTIAAHSRGPGHGAAFVVRLPVYSMRADALPRVAAVASPAGSSPRDARPLENTHVLVVEDEPDARELVVELLEEYGAKVQATASAPEALEALKHADADVLVADLGLPGEDGLSLMRKVRALAGPKASTPAIALTAYVHVDDRARAMAAGFDGYLPKPIDPDCLVEAVAALVHREEAPQGCAAAAFAAPA
jgi:CheY-like chemotaxis protein/nitrogen-specific signal transduction histidine kinase